MYKHTCRRADLSGTVRALFYLGALVLVFGVGCGGGPKRQPPPRHSEVKRLASEGSYWFRKGCFNKAERYFYQALEASRLVDDLEEMVRALNNLGAVALAQNHTMEAGEHLHQALELNSLLKSRREESFALGNLGSLAFKAGRGQEAEELWEKAVAVAEKDANKSGLANHLNNLAMFKRKQGRLEEAESLIQQAIAITEEKGNTESLANSHMQLGLVARARGDLSLAEKHLSEAVEIDRAVENPLGLAQDLKEIGLLYQEEQLWEKAFLDLDRAIRLYVTMGKLEQAKQLLELLKINQIKGGVPESLEQYEGLLVPPDEYWESPLCR